jgi:hypothetical protein
MPQQPWMLIGLAAVAIPIIIHLLNRRKAINVDWGAMQFLLGSLVSRSRRMLLEEMLLLALRCLLLALLALAMSLPFIPPGSQIPWQVILPAVLLGAVALGVGTAMWQHRRWRWRLYGIGLVLLLLASGSWLVQRYWQIELWRTSGGAQDVAIVIDGSASMTIETDGRSNFERAREEAGAVIESLQRGDAVSVVLAGPRPQVKTPTPIVNRKDLHRILADLRPTGGPMATVEALGAAAITLAEGDNALKKIVLITDGQNVGWETHSSARWEMVASELDALPAPPRIVCRRLDLPREFTNVHVADVSLSRKIIGPDRPVAIHVRLENSGTGPTSEFDVDLVVDGTDTLTKSVGQLSPGASETVTFHYQFATGGLHTLEARATLNDNLAVDNAQARVVKTLQRLPVLVIDGNPAPQPLDRASAFIEIALAPKSEREEDASTAPAAEDEPADGGRRRRDLLVEPTIVDAPDVRGIEGFGAYSVVILADVPKLPERQAKLLARFVADGGGLLIAAGERCVPTFYDDWKTDGGLRVAPATITERVVRTEDEPAHPSVSTFRHDALTVIADNPHTDMDAAALTAFWRLETDEQDATASQCGVLDTGDPFVAERRLGKGRVLMTCMSLDYRGSNLPTLQSFVPLVHELVYFLVHPPRTALNHDPSNQLVLKLSGSAQGSGLRGDYFKKTNFTEYVTSRVDPVLHVNWRSSPVRGIPHDNFSVRWTGSIIPEHSEIHLFHLTADDEARVWIDGKLVCTARLKRPGQGTAQLAAGRRHDIRVEFREGSHWARLKLEWSGPRTPRQVVPTQRFAPLRPLSRQLAGDVKAGLAPPSGPKREVQLLTQEDQIVARIDDAVQPGLYRVHLPKFMQESFSDFLDAHGTVPFSVSGSPEESTLVRLSETEIENVRAHVEEFHFAPTSQHMVRMLTSGVPGRHLWKYLAVAALFALLLETALARWIAQRRKTGSEQVVDFTSVATDPSAFRSRAEEMVGKNAGNNAA